MDEGLPCLAARLARRILTAVFLPILVLAQAYGLPFQSSASAKGVEGDWEGTLKAGGAELRLVVHITKSPDGRLGGSMDSIDQGAKGIPITSMTFNDSKLTFSVDSIQGSYDGKANSDLTAIAGTWSQSGQSFALDLKRATTPVKTEHKPAKPSDIDGPWQGTLETGAASLRLVFHITNTEDGLIATLDSLDQGAKGIPVTTVTRQGASLKLEVKGIGGVFEGTIAKDLSSIDGTWSQGGGSFPLVLKRVKDAAELEPRRPQNPVKPYPYREEEVEYANAAASLKLAATLTIPPGKGTFPAVLLITGSGPQDRDESLMGHKPFLVLSDYLTRRGIIVLRADDRGVGKSGGDFHSATTADFATDAEAGVAYLQTRSEVDPHRIGLVGHSEGGVIAPMVAARSPAVAFIVMMAGSGVRGDELLPEQARLISEAMGTKHDKAVKDAEEERELLTLVEQEKDPAALERELREKLAGKVPETQLGMQVKQVTSPWFRYFLTYDPASSLRKVTCPVLAINGEKDLQVPPQQNLPAIRQALRDAGNREFEAVELPGLNHLFQTAKTGSPTEYAQIEETMSPVALAKVTDWILRR
jgi:fermentation-respiration switch protein FrsA (DUF1100 family)